MIGVRPSNDLTMRVAEMWPRWFPGRPLPPLRPVVMAGGPGHPGRGFVFLVTPRGKPEVVLKVAFTSEEIRYLTGEFEVLETLFRRLPPAMRQQVPAPLGILQAGSRFAVAMSALTGRRLLVPDITASASAPARLLLRRFFRRTFGWSRSLASATETGPPVGAEVLAKRVERFLLTFPQQSRTRRRLERFGAAVEGSRLAWRPAWQHGDLAVGNVLVHRGQLRLLDWEHGRGGREPWFDVSYAPGVTAALGQRQAGFPSLVHAASPVLTGWAGEVLRAELERVWDYPLPLQWAITLTAMEAAVRRVEHGRRGWAPWAEFAVALVSDGPFREALPWLVPEW
jgi:aminoglycoside phosphotransferase (APT) family kinase protein